MRCKKIQELLKTNYLDGEVNPRQLRIISGHLIKCWQCRILENELQSQRKIFEGAKQKPVPGRVWQNIYEAIVAEGLNKESSLRIGILEQLKHLLFPPRPVVALAGIIAAVIFTFILTSTITRKNEVFNDEISRESLTVYSFNSDNGDLIDSFGTNVEQYFL